MLSQLVGQLLFFFAAVFLFSSTASADTATWLFPAYVPNAPPIAFESQDTIDVSWTSSFVAPVLSLFCKTGSNSDITLNFQSPTSVLPNGSYALPLKSVQNADADCHLNLNETQGPRMGTANSSNSGNFLVNVQSDRSATTWSTSIATATTTPPASSSPPPPPSSSTTTSAAAARPITSPSPPRTSSLSNGAKIGIGIGVAIGVLALTSVLFLFCMRARRRRKQQLQRAQDKHRDCAVEMDGRYALPEMDGRSGKGAEEGEEEEEEKEEKDGLPIARRQTAGELEAEPL